MSKEKIDLRKEKISLIALSGHFTIVTESAILLLSEEQVEELINFKEDDE